MNTTYQVDLALLPEGMEQGKSLIFNNTPSLDYEKTIYAFIEAVFLSHCSLERIKLIVKEFQLGESNSVNVYTEGYIDGRLVLTSNLSFLYSCSDNWEINRERMNDLTAYMPGAAMVPEKHYIYVCSGSYCVAQFSSSNIWEKKLSFDEFSFNINVLDEYASDFFLQKNEINVISKSYALGAEKFFYNSKRIIYGYNDLSLKYCIESGNINLDERLHSLLPTFLDDNSMITSKLSFFNEEDRLTIIDFLASVFVEECNSNKGFYINSKTFRKFMDIYKLHPTPKEEVTSCLENQFNLYLHCVLVNDGSYDTKFYDRNEIVIANFFTRENINIYNEEDIDSFMSEINSYIDSRDFFYDGHPSKPGWLNIFTAMTNFLNNDDIEAYIGKENILKALFTLSEKINDLTDGMLLNTDTYFSSHHYKIIIENYEILEKYLENNKYCKYGYMNSVLRFKCTDFNKSDSLAYVVESQKMKLFFKILKRFNSDLYENKFKDEDLERSIDDINNMLKSYYPDIVFNKNIASPLVVLLYRIMPLAIPCTTELHDELCPKAKKLLTTILNKIEKKKCVRLPEEINIDGKIFVTESIKYFASVISVEKNSTNSRELADYVNDIKSIVDPYNFDTASRGKFIGPLYYSSKKTLKTFALIISSSLSIIGTVLYSAHILNLIFKINIFYLSLFNGMFAGVFGLIIPSLYLANVFINYFLARDVFYPKIDDLIEFNWPNSKIVMRNIYEGSGHNTIYFVDNNFSSPEKKYDGDNYNDGGIIDFRR
jgi:hypothetical protein